MAILFIEWILRNYVTLCVWSRAQEDSVSESCCTSACHAVFCVLQIDSKKCGLINLPENLHVFRLKEQPTIYALELVIQRINKKHLYINVICMQILNSNLLSKNAESSRDVGKLAWIKMCCGWNIIWCAGHLIYKKNYFFKYSQWHDSRRHNSEILELINSHGM